MSDEINSIRAKAQAYTAAMHSAWADRFWRRVDRSGGSDACWPWIGSRNRKGYGGFFPRRDVNLRAHRVSWEIANRRVRPNDLQVLHACDNPPCVNPAHLFLGSHNDNMHDMVEKGRSRNLGLSGDQHPNHKLTSVQVAAIRVRLAAGESQRSIGLAFGVTQTMVSRIALGKAWQARRPLSLRINLAMEHAR